MGARIIHLLCSIRSVTSKLDRRIMYYGRDNPVSSKNIILSKLFHLVDTLSTFDPSFFNKVCYIRKQKIGKSFYMKKKTLCLMIQILSQFLIDTLIHCYSLSTYIHVVTFCINYHQNT